MFMLILIGIYWWAKISKKNNKLPIKNLNPKNCLSSSIRNNKNPNNHLKLKSKSNKTINNQNHNLSKKSPINQQYQISRSMWCKVLIYQLLITINYLKSLLFLKILPQIKNHLPSHLNNFNLNQLNKKLNVSNFNKIFSIIIKMYKLTFWSIYFLILVFKNSNKIVL